MWHRVRFLQKLVWWKSPVSANCQRQWSMFRLSLIWCSIGIADLSSSRPGLLPWVPQCWSSSASPSTRASAGCFSSSAPFSSMFLMLILLGFWSLPISSLYMVFTRNIIYFHNWNYHLNCDNFQIASPFWTSYPAILLNITSNWICLKLNLFLFFQSLPSSQI